MAELPDKEFAEKLKADPPAVADAARTLLPDLDDPEFRAFLVAKIDLWRSRSTTGTTRSGRPT